MKNLIIIVLLISNKLNAQTKLTFDKRFVQCEDKWVAFQPDKDSAFAYGFIYIDAQAGLTLNYEGTFKISSTGEFLQEKIDTTNIKIRLEPNDVLVAVIPEYKFTELKIPATPDWLKYYKTDTNSVTRLYRWGYLYNSWGECERALRYLKRAEMADPKYNGLAVELAFSYNCLKLFNNAEAILKEAIKANPADAYVNKEYIYTLTKNNGIAKAESQFETSIKQLKDNQYNAENCYNILEYYYFQKDKANFGKWYKILQTHPTENKMITQYADTMKTNMGQ